MTIIVLEIPHQQPAFAWVADNWYDAARRCARRDGMTPGLLALYFARDGAPPLSEVVNDWLSNGNHAAYTFETADDVNRFLSTYKGHQQIAATTALRVAATAEGWTRR